MSGFEGKEQGLGQASSEEESTETGATVPILGIEYKPANDVATTTVKLSDLGPIIVNTNGTLSRIPNWNEMTEAERINTQRLITKRNKNRLQELKDATGLSTKQVLDNMLDFDKDKDKDKEEEEEQKISSIEEEDKARIEGVESRVEPTPSNMDETIESSIED